jgi:excisionase family DNA binding protein
VCLCPSSATPGHFSPRIDPRGLPSCPLEAREWPIPAALTLDTPATALREPLSASGSTLLTWCVRGPNGEGTLTERSSGRRDARRVTVGEAAALLGISKEAVRMRIRRGTLRSEKTDDRVYVWLDDDLNADQDTVQHGNQTAYRELIEQLRGEVEAWREEARRKDHIIAGLIERLPPQLEPPRAGEAEPPDEPGDDLTATEDPDRGCPGPMRPQARRRPYIAPGGAGCGRGEAWAGVSFSC